MLDSSLFHTWLLISSRTIIWGMSSFWTHNSASCQPIHRNRKISTSDQLQCLLFLVHCGSNWKECTEQDDKMMCEGASVAGKNTDHSLRASKITSLFQAGVAKKVIHDRSGHRLLVYIRGATDRGLQCQRVPLRELFSSCRIRCLLFAAKTVLFSAYCSEKLTGESPCRCGWCIGHIKAAD